MARLSRIVSALSLAMLLALVSSGCQVRVDYGDTAFACSAGECPSGYTCQAELCVSDSIEPPDEEEPDASVTPPPDASAPDAQALAACDDAFALAPGYQLCSEDETSCSFNVNTAGGTCAQACDALGSTCLAAFGNADIDLCLPEEGTTDTCDTPRASEICQCARVAPTGMN